MFKVRIFNAKSGKRCCALVFSAPYKDYFLSFDTDVICACLDITQTQLCGLALGEYPVKEV